MHEYNLSGQITYQQETFFRLGETTKIRIKSRPLRLVGRWVGKSVGKCYKNACVSRYTVEQQVCVCVCVCVSVSVWMRRKRLQAACWCLMSFAGGNSKVSGIKVRHWSLYLGPVLTLWACVAAGFPS